MSPKSAPGVVMARDKVTVGLKQTPYARKPLQMCDKRKFQNPSMKRFTFRLHIIVIINYYWYSAVNVNNQITIKFINELKFHSWLSNKFNTNAFNICIDWFMLFPIRQLLCEKLNKCKLNNAHNRPMSIEYHPQFACCLPICSQLKIRVDNDMLSPHRVQRRVDFASAVSAVSVLPFSILAPSNVRVVSSKLFVCVNTAIKEKRKQPYELKRTNKKEYLSETAMRSQILCFLACPPNKYQMRVHKCCIDRPIPSQVVIPKIIASPPCDKITGLMSIVTKIIIQLNAKLMGVPWYDEPLTLFDIWTTPVTVCTASVGGGGNIRPISNKHKQNLF
uniref:Uncharacterized protein n=1 Tax=Glossina austeni TaxID=7395 RepID=A0A1A9VVB6_GLOAU